MEYLSHIPFSVFGFHRPTITGFLNTLNI